MIYPLVLLHITILPLVLPWTHDVVKQTLPNATTQDLALLKGRLSDTILQRGILVPHPQEDFDLLTERILDALELASSTTTLFTDYEEECESSHGVHANYNNPCHTCGETTCFSSRPEKKWEVRIFAANGLLRADAWDVAWSEMERVDVEIFPNISDVQRRMLDETQLEADAEQATQAAWSHQQGLESVAQIQDALGGYRVQPASLSKEEISEAKRGATERFPIRHDSVPEAPRTDQAIPAAYKAHDIPLGILIKNYLYLLAQDRRKMAILFLVLTMVFATVQGMSAQRSKMAIDRADEWVDYRVLPSAGSAGDTWSSLHAQSDASRRLSETNAMVVEDPQTRDERHPLRDHESFVDRTPTADRASAILMTSRNPNKEQTDSTQHCRNDVSVFDMMCMKDEVG